MPIPYQDKYQAYLPELTKEQQKAIDDAENARFELEYEMEYRRGYVGFGRNETLDEYKKNNPSHADLGQKGYLYGGELYNDPGRKAYFDVAIDQARQQLADFPYPEDEHIATRFPGSNPKGCYCHIDAGFNERLIRIDAQAQFRQDELNSLIDRIRNHPQFKETAEIVTGNCESHRLYTRAAKLCRDRYAAVELMQQAQRIETEKTEIPEYDIMIQGIEYLCGIKQTLPDEVADLYKNKLGIPDLSAAREEATRKQVRIDPEKGITVNFEDLNQILHFQKAAKPENWGKQLDSTKVTAEDAVSSHIFSYTDATMQRYINPLKKYCQNAGLDYTELLIIDGKTASERLKERGLTPDDIFEAGVEVSAMVASALMTGKRVETFIPNGINSVSRKPVPIQAEGYNPNLDKNVTLNGWERFWSKWGFYKEKVSIIEEQRQAQAARERVRDYVANKKIENNPTYNPLTCQQTAQSNKDIFFPDNSLKQALRGSHLFPRTVERTSATNHCITIMANKYPIEDILDPTKLVAEKQALGQKYLEATQKRDYKWFADKLYHGSEALTLQVERISKETNWNSPAQRTAAIGILRAATMAGFDTAQDVESEKNVEAVFNHIAEGYAPNHTDPHLTPGSQLLLQLAQMGDTAKGLYEAVAAQENLRNPEQKVTGLDLARLGAGNAIVNKLAQGESFSNIQYRSPAPIFLADAKLDNNSRTVRQFNESADNRRALRMALDSGDFAIKMNDTALIFGHKKDSDDSKLISKTDLDFKPSNPEHAKQFHKGQVSKK